MNNSGEWKLGSFEYVTSTESAVSQHIKLPSLNVYDPPEKNDYKKNLLTTKW